ncbi:MAG: tetratricopeptide repeat protein [Rhizobiaceae bacterium]
MNRQQRRANQARSSNKPSPIKQQNQLSGQELVVAKIFALANKQMKSNDNTDAVKTFQSILDHASKPGPIYHNMAVCLERLGLDQQALDAYRLALDHDPTLVASYTNIGVLLHKHKKVEAAIKILEHAISIDPEFSTAHLNLGSAYNSLGELEKTLQCYRKAAAIGPESAIAQYELIALRYRIYDWRNLERDTSQYLSNLRDNNIGINPFNLVTMNASLADIHQHSTRYVKSIGAMEARNFTEYKTAPFSKNSMERRRIKIGFVSSDFKQHPVGFHLLELLETFDRKRFEIFGFCHSREQDTDIQKKLRAAFDRFVPIRGVADLDAAEVIHDNGIDILVNLNGHSADGRNRIFSYRPAPIQINYLGYPATMGADYIDYIIADEVVVPMEHQPHYTESIVHLPDTFFPVDCRRKASKNAPTRTEYGLPENKFVFSCFNTTNKITPEMFDIWMRLLEKVEGSVLWLFEANVLCKNNLQREIIARNIDPTRVIFAQKVDLAEDHQARCALPDLFLDTIPYNAHATTADALCAGLPVLTCLGEAFAGRVASSMLSALDMPEMITNSLEEYETTALDLANNPAKLKKIREKLGKKIAAGPLFDGVKYTRNLEQAFENMVHLRSEGKNPEPFSVSRLTTD